MSEIDVLYICDYGQSGFNICPLMDEKCDKKDSCNLRAVVPYKQLQQLKDYIKEDLAPTCQRLQKENEELRNLHINLVGVKECEIKELVQLKSRLDSYEKDGGALDEGQAWANEAMASRDEISKLNNCLDEIEEIVKGMFGPYTDVYELSEHLLRVECKRILNKIKEVKDNE